MLQVLALIHSCVVFVDNGAGQEPSHAASVGVNP